jgi:HEAT repeat protein
VIRPVRTGIGALTLGALLLGCGGGVDSPSPERRAKAVRALVSEPGARPVPALLVAQRDPSPLVRLAAAEAIAQRRAPHAAEALGAMLADPEPRVAGAAAQGLARLGDLDGARAALTEGYGPASPEARRAIADALDEIGVALRDAVEAESRRLWARNLAVLANGSPAARAGAAEELGASGRSEAVARLREVISLPGEDPGVLVAALRGLGEAGDLTARPVLEKALESTAPQMALSAAHALGRLGDPESSAPLARLAAAGSGPLNLAAFDALDALPLAPEVSQALCGVAQRNGSPALAARAARAAWTRNADCPASAFAARAGRGDPAALTAIAELHPEPSVRGPLVAKLVATLADARASTDRRARAARALGQLDATAAIPVAEPRARALATRLAALRARWIPGEIPGGRPLPAEEGTRLPVLLARPATAPSTSAASSGAAPEWIDPAPAAELEELAALLGSLGKLRDAAARDLLVAAASDPSPTVRAGAIEGLGHLGGTAPPQELSSALSDGSERVRAVAVAVLPRFGSAAIPVLERGLPRAMEGDARFAAALAQALGQTGSPAALGPLEKLLESAAPAAAAISIAALGAAEGAEPLVAHLNRKGAPGRVEALEALAQLASNTAGPAFATELLSDRAEIRATAARAIGRLRYEPASHRLEALRVDYDGRVRRAAMEALAKLPSNRPGMR